MSAGWPLVFCFAAPIVPVTLLAVFFDRRRSSRRVVDLNVEREARRPVAPSNVTRIGWEGNVRQLPRGRGWSA